MSSVMPSSSTESANVVVKKAMLMASHVTAEGYEIDHKQPHQDPCANSKPSTNGTRKYFEYKETCDNSKIFFRNLWFTIIFETLAIQKLLRIRYLLYSWLHNHAPAICNGFSFSLPKSGQDMV